MIGKYWCDTCKNRCGNLCSICVTTEENEKNSIPPSKYISIPSEKLEKEVVNHPAHYQGKNECIDVMVGMFGKQAVMDFCRCNAYKYRFRAAMTTGEEDIKKAEWYEKKLLEMLGEK